jgi:hypothetical protein
MTALIWLSFAVWPLALVLATVAVYVLLLTAAFAVLRALDRWGKAAKGHQETRDKA